MTETLKRPAGPAPIAAVMTSDLTTVMPGADLLDAFSLMIERKIHHLPLVDTEGHCLVLIDFPAISVGLLEALAMDREIALPRPGMSAPPQVNPDDSLQRAADAMRTAGADACVVVDATDRMLGIVTARDVVDAVADSAA